MTERPVALPPNSSRKRSLPLPPAQEYRRRAVAVRERAGALPLGQERDGLLRIAAQWDRLAQYKDDQELD